MLLCTVVLIDCCLLYPFLIHFVFSFLFFYSMIGSFFVGVGVSPSGQLLFPLFNGRLVCQLVTFFGKSATICVLLHLHFPPFFN